MGAEGVLHKSHSQEPKSAGRGTRSQTAETTQCESEPAARRISGAATWDSSLR